LVSRSKRHDLVFGRQPVLSLFEAGTPVEKVIFQRGATGEAIVALKDLCKRFRVPMQAVPREALARMTSGNHQGVLAYTAEIGYQLLEDLLPFLYEEGASPFLVALDGVTDVRTFGAIARTALGAGAHGLVVGMRDAAPANSEAIKASAGALLNIPVCRELTMSSALEQMQQHGLMRIGLAAEGAHFPWQEDLTIPFVIVAGAEGEGLSSAIREQLDLVVKLPMPGDFDSYNVSVAVAMLAYEAAKQRLGG